MGAGLDFFMNRQNIRTYRKNSNKCHSERNEAK